MVASKIVVLSLASLLLLPGPLAAAKELSLPPVDPVRDVAAGLPAVPALLPDAVVHGGLVRLPGPDGAEVAVHVPVAFAASEGHALLGYPPAVRAKLHADLLDLAPLVKEGLVTTDGRVPVLVKHHRPLTTDVLDATLAFARFGLLAGRVSLADLPLLALDPSVERVFLDGGNRPDLSASVPHIRADQVHARNDSLDRPVTGVGVTIAILDTGVDHTHPDLGGCLGAGCKVVEARSFTDDALDASDDYGHGTHVAATAAGVHGVAPGASILNYKVLENGWGYDSWIIAGIENATLAGADVVSMSLGGWGATDTPLALAADWAVSQGVVVVSAAGNSGCYGCVGEPATSLSGIAVGATNRDYDDLAWFSSRGPVFSSAGDVVGIKPDLVAPGVGIVAAVPNGSCVLCDPSGYLALSGTSMATPHVSGVAALLLQAYPELTPDDVKGALMGSSVDISRAGSLADSRSQGAGRVDALAAFEAEVSILPGNGFAGLDLAGETIWTRDWPLQVKNLKNASLALDADAVLRVFKPGESAADAPDPSWAPNALVDGGLGASDPYANVTAGGPLGAGWSYDLTLTNLTLNETVVTLYAPDGSWWTQRDAYPDGAHAEKFNVTFSQLYLAQLGVWRAVAGDVEVRFGVGGVDVATHAPDNLTLAPGETRTLVVNLTVDNARADDGWHEGVATLSGDAAAHARVTFVKSGVLRLILDADAWFGYVVGDNGFVDIVGAGNTTLLAPAGTYEFFVARFGCPANATECASGSFQFHVLQDVVHESETTVDLRTPEDTNLVSVVPRFEDGSVLPSTAPYCNWGDTVGPCHESGGLLFSSNRTWLAVGISLGGGLAPVWVSDTGWNVGRDLVYWDGDRYLVIGDAAAGLTTDLVIEPEGFEAREFRYASPAGASPALRIRTCWLPFGYGFGNGRHLGDNETLLWGVKPLVVGNGSWGSRAMLMCQNVEMLHIVSETNVTGTACFYGGCRSAWSSPIQRWENGSFEQRRGLWSTTPLAVGAADGAIAVQEGASWYAGSPYSVPGTVYAYPDWYAMGYAQHFAPATGGSQHLRQASDSLQTLTVALDGAVVSTQTLDWSNQVGIASYSGEGLVTMTLRTNASFVLDAVGTATYVAEFPSSWNSGYLPTLREVRLEDAGGVETVFEAADPPVLRFREDLGWLTDRTLANVSVGVTHLESGSAVATCCLTAVDRAYETSLPTMGAGTYALTISAEGPGGSTITLTQSPAYRLLEAEAPPNEAPLVAIDSPAEGETVSGVVNVTGSAYDANGNDTITLVEVRVAGGEWRPADGTTAWSYSFDSDAYPEGTLTIEARAFDGELHSRTGSVTVVVDRPSPNRPPTVEIVSPYDGETVWGWTTLSGTSTDPDGNETLAAVELSLDGGEWFPANGTSSWSSLLDTTTLADGWHVLAARASDGEAHSLQDEVWFHVDNVYEPPCEADLVVTSVEVERTPLRTRAGDLENDAARHVVRATIENVGACEAWGFGVQAEVRGSARIPGTTGGLGTREDLGWAWVDAVAPGESAVVEFEWDGFGNLGDQTIVVHADPWEHVPESDEENNARSVRTWFVVGGLGGVALPAIPAPYVEP